MKLIYPSLRAPALLALSWLLLATGCISREEAVLQSDSEAELNKTIEAYKHSQAKPLIIIWANPGRPSTVGGVGVAVHWVSTSDKVIKAVRFYVTALSRAGDPTPSETRGKATAVLNETGPFSAGYRSDDGLSVRRSDDASGVRWGPVWYNPLVRFVRIDHIEVDFVDGTKETLQGQRLSDCFLRPEVNQFGAGLQQKYEVILRNAGKRFEIKEAWQTTYDR
ncbi:MAG: hypothetical protein JWM32_3055 [Verrucomicrobia bacterium]|nr:hypothetical protein [Verrucomicrobiota bacterium]